jgi:hypothetical protein
MPRNRETNIQNSALLAVGADRDVLAWRQQSGAFRRMDDPTNLVRVGVPGMSDALAVVAVTIDASMIGQTIGVAVAAEFKTDTGRQSQAQRDWQAAFEARGGLYRLVRSDADMLELIADAKAGRRPSR